MNKKVVVITGPTASGKTNLAIKLAHKINAEIVCADSRIIYKNLDIVSAKPDLDEQEGIAHHLIDIMEPFSEFSAGDFVKAATEAIDDIFLRGKNVIVAGGTWFYIKSLLLDKELLDCPVNPKLRLELSKLEGTELWAKLNALDSKRAECIHPNNKDKIIRSIEMCTALNAPVSSYKREENKKYESIWFMPDLEREILYERINKRVDIMLDAGLYSEWERNKKKYPDSKILQNTIGYREFFDLEKGVYADFNFAVDKIKQHTRNFAKRQLTYFRSNEKIKPVKNLEEMLKDIEC